MGMNITKKVKMETLCSKFYAVFSGTSGDIDMGSSGECLESKNWQSIFCTYWPFSWLSPLTLKKGTNYLIFWVLLNRYGPRIFQKNYNETNSVVISLSIKNNVWYSGRWPSGCQISKAFYCYLNYIILLWRGMPIRWAQSFHFDCKATNGGWQWYSDNMMQTLIYRGTSWYFNTKSIYYDSTQSLQEEITTIALLYWFLSLSGVAFLKRTDWERQTFFL